ncbi:MAG: 5'-deoxynucleotidase [Clostridia bacterium]|nr:5'-deoxynucleotidase [Clostridia bacterium]
MYNFFAYMSRMKLIKRWSLMKAVTDENIAEHSAEVAQIAHALAVIANKLYGKNINADRVTTLALYHESSEVITGDLPTPIKYYNPEIRKAYKDIESVANQKLISMLPEELREEYIPLVEQDADSYEHKLVKAADKLSAYVKCIDELKSGNREFAKAEAALSAEVAAYHYLPEVKYFCDNFLESYSKTLDELD